MPLYDTYLPIPSMPSPDQNLDPHRRRSWPSPFFHLLRYNTATKWPTNDSTHGSDDKPIAWLVLNRAVDACLARLLHFVRVSQHSPHLDLVKNKSSFFSLCWSFVFAPLRDPRLQLLITHTIEYLNSDSIEKTWDNSILITSCWIEYEPERSNDEQRVGIGCDP